MREINIQTDSTEQLLFDWINIKLKQFPISDEDVFDVLSKKYPYKTSTIKRTFQGSKEILYNNNVSFRKKINKYNKLVDGNNLTFTRMTKRNIQIKKYKKEKDIEKYNSSPKLCLYCKKAIEYRKSHNKFCGRECVGLYNSEFYFKNNPISGIKTIKKDEKFIHIRNCPSCNCEIEHARRNNAVRLLNENAECAKCRGFASTKNSSIMKLVNERFEQLNKSMNELSKLIK